MRKIIGIGLLMSPLIALAIFGAVLVGPLVMLGIYAVAVAVVAVVAGGAWLATS